MNIVMPVYTNSKSNFELIRDMLYVCIYTFFKYNLNTNKIIVLTNSDVIAKDLRDLKNFYDFNIEIESIDFEKEWDRLGFQINPIKERRSFIISKFLPIFIFDFDFLMMDWDILNTSEYMSIFSDIKRTTFFSAKNYDGDTLRQNSLYMGLGPIPEKVGNFKWLNSGFVYFRVKKIRQLIKSYWNVFNSIDKHNYKGIYLFNIVDDELIYNLMKIDNVPEIEECTKYNINVVPRNFYYSYSYIKDMELGRVHPYVLNVHFVIGHIKPYSVVIDDDSKLHIEILLDKYNLSKKEIKWCLDIDRHRMGSYHYNAVIFSIIWQYYRYKILEEMGIDNNKKSKRYLDFFNNYIRDA